MRKRRINSRQQAFKQLWQHASIRNQNAIERASAKDNLGSGSFSVYRPEGTIVQDNSNWFGKATSRLGEILFGEDDGTNFIDRAKAVYENPSGAWHSFHQQRLAIKFTHDSEQLS